MTFAASAHHNLVCFWDFILGLITQVDGGSGQTIN